MPYLLEGKVAFRVTEMCRGHGRRDRGGREIAKEAKDLTLGWKCYEIPNYIKEGLVRRC